MTMVWTVHSPQPQRAATLARAAGVHRVTAQCLINRGVRSEAAAKRFLSPSLSTLEDPFKLPAMTIGVKRLRRAIDRRESILVFGDSDVDGLTATAILYEVLAGLGANVRAKLSNRIEDGYGLSTSTVTQACRDATKLVVLVDCGTNQAGEVRRLCAHGIDVVIVDHHRPLEDPAEPLALINPYAQDGMGRELCSAGLAFKITQALLAEEAPERLAAFLDLAALGTLADYVPLLEESRVIASQGLPRITSSLRPGLARLCEATRTREAVPDQIIRRLVPRINAFGRLGDPTTAWHLLLARDDDRLEEWLAEAEQVHATTKKLQRRIIAEAEEQVSRLHFRDQYVLVVSRHGWHQGLMGPLASQLTARYGRPSIAIAMKDSVGTGSARSIPLFDLLKALKSCEASLVQFGGHAQACGLTLEPKNLEAFRVQVNEHARKSLGREALVKAQTVDMELSANEVQPDWVDEMERFAPFGPGNPRPSVLLRGVTLEMKSPRTAWLTSGTRRFPAKGRFPSVASGVCYDVAVTPAVVNNEVTLALNGAKVSPEPSARVQI